MPKSKRSPASILFLLLLAGVMLLTACAGGGTPGVTDTDSPGTSSGGPDTTEEGGTNEMTGTTTEPDPDIPKKSTEFDSKNIVLSFGAISDTHVNTTRTATHDMFRNALKQLIAKAEEDDPDGIDAVAIVGDFVSNAVSEDNQPGRDERGKTEINYFIDILAEFKSTKIGTNVIFTIGNHDTRTQYTKMPELYKLLGEDYFSHDVYYDLEKGCRHCVFGDYHFLMLEPTKYSQDLPYDKDVLDWLDKTLAEITAKEPEAYVFLFTHPAIYGMTYGTEEYFEVGHTRWRTKYLTPILKKYPQAMIFTGHTHTPINDERSIMQADFTAVNDGSTSSLAIIVDPMYNLYVNQDAVPFNTISSGLLVQVDVNGNVRITRMFFTEGTEFKTPWILEYPQADKSHLSKYSRKDRTAANTPPVMSGEITFRRSPTNDLAGTLSFPAGNDDDMVHHYDITVCDEDTGKNAQNYKICTDFYCFATPDGMRKTIDFDLPVPDRDVKITVKAVDVWDAESNELSLILKKPSTSSEATSIPETYADVDFTGSTAVDTKDKLKIEIKNGAQVGEKSFVFAGKTATLPAFNVAKNEEHAILTFKEYSTSTISQFYNSDTGFTFEAMFVNRAPSGNQALVSDMQQGGWGFWGPSGILDFRVTIENGGSGSAVTIKSEKAASTTQLTHVIGTAFYDKNENKTYVSFYINGELAGSGTGLNKIRPAAGRDANIFCFGADVSSPPKVTYTTSDFSLTDFKIYKTVVNNRQAAAIYAKAVENFGK